MSDTQDTNCQPILEPHLDPFGLWQELASDEEYWDYLDDLEASMGDCHEWDNMVLCGDAR